MESAYGKERRVHNSVFLCTRCMHKLNAEFRKLYMYLRIENLIYTNIFLCENHNVDAHDVYFTGRVPRVYWSV